MNQPTEDRIKKLEERMDRIEQHTEPINLRIERGLPVPEATLLQNLMEMSGTQATDVGKLKGDMGEVKAIVANIKATVSDQGELLNTLKTNQDAQDKKLDLILSLLQKED